MATKNKKGVEIPFSTRLSVCFLRALWKRLKGLSLSLDNNNFIDDMMIHSQYFYQDLPDGELGAIGQYFLSNYQRPRSGRELALVVELPLDRAKRFMAVLQDAKPFTWRDPHNSMTMDSLLKDLKVYLIMNGEYNQASRIGKSIVNEFLKA